MFITTFTRDSATDHPCELRETSRHPSTVFC